MNDSEPDELSAKLRAWTVEPQVPDSFSRGVWQRIAARQAERADAFWPGVARWFSTQLVRPRYAVALVVISVSASLGMAHMQAQEMKSKNWKALEARYAASIDPLAMSR